MIYCRQQEKRAIWMEVFRAIARKAQSLFSVHSHVHQRLCTGWGSRYWNSLDSGDLLYRACSAAQGVRGRVSIALGEGTSCEFQKRSCNNNGTHEGQGHSAARHGKPLRRRRSNVQRQRPSNWAAEAAKRERIPLIIQLYRALSPTSACTTLRRSQRIRPRTRTCRSPCISTTPRRTRSPCAASRPASRPSWWTAPRGRMRKTSR